MRRPSARTTSPASGSASPERMRISVLLPLPLGPSRPSFDAGREHEIDAAEERSPAERLGDALRGQQLPRLPAGGVEVELDLRRLVVLRVRSSARSSIICPACWMRPFAFVVRAFAPRRSHSISRRTCPASACSRRCCAARYSSRFSRNSLYGAVDAQVPARVGAVQLHDAVGDVLQEIAVVADEHERERGGREQLLQPEDALEVEVVGRLVEQQQVRLADQLPRDRRAACATRRTASRRPGRCGRTRPCRAAPPPRSPTRARRRAAWLSRCASTTTSSGVAPAGNVSCCGRYPSRTLRRASIEPASGCSAPARIFSSVDLPEPLGPISPVRSASSKRMLNPRKIVRGPKDFSSESVASNNAMGWGVLSGRGGNWNVRRSRYPRCVSGANPSSARTRLAAAQNGGFGFQQLDDGRGRDAEVDRHGGRVPVERGEQVEHEPGGRRVERMAVGQLRAGCRDGSRGTSPAGESRRGRPVRARPSRASPAAAAGPTGGFPRASGTRSP